MKSDEMRTKVEELQKMDEEEEITVFKVSGADWDWEIKDQQPLKFVEEGRELGAEIFYYMKAEEEGKITNLWIGYQLEDRIHRIDIVADWYQDQLREEQGIGEEDEEPRTIGRYSEEVNEKLKDRKEEILEELRNKDNLDMLSEENKIRLKHGKPEDFRFQELERMQNQIFDAEGADEETEDELAEKVYEDESFNRNFNQLDTETLLKSREDIPKEKYEKDEVRLEMIHKKAKSLLKIE